LNRSSPKDLRKCSSTGKNDTVRKTKYPNSTLLAYCTKKSRPKEFTLFILTDEHLLNQCVAKSML
jgi:hypothetical protein